MSGDAAPWAQTFSGRAVDLIAPTPDQIALVDIAHALSRIARFNGHTKSALPWTVAQHSLLVESLLPPESGPETGLLALLHDAHEAYTGDPISPMRNAIRLLLKGFSRYDTATGKSITIENSNLPLGAIEEGLDAAIRAAFALPMPTAEQCGTIKAADMLALRVERDALMSAPPREWAPLPEPPDPLPLLCTTIMPDDVKAEFIARVRALVDARHGV